MANFLDNLKNALASWAQKNPKAAQNVLKLEKPVQKAKQFLVNPPKVQYTEKLTSGIKNPYLRTATQIPIGMTESFVNAPGQYASGITKTGLNIGEMLKGNKVKAPEMIGNIAQTGEGILNLSMIPGLSSLGKSAFKEGGKIIAKKTMGNILKEGAWSGAKYGTTFGALSGLQKNAKANTVKEQLMGTAKELPANIASGAALGALISGGTYGAGKLIKNIKLKNEPGFAKLDEPIIKTPKPKLKQPPVEGGVSISNKPYKFKYTSDEMPQTGKAIIFNGKEVGGIGTGKDLNGKDTWLANIEIEPKYRNQGIGKKVIQQLQAQGKTINGYAESPEAIQFFKKVGAEVDSDGNFILKPSPSVVEEGVSKVDTGRIDAIIRQLKQAGVKIDEKGLTKTGSNAFGKDIAINDNLFNAQIHTPQGSFEYTSNQGLRPVKGNPWSEIVKYYQDNKYQGSEVLNSASKVKSVVEGGVRGEGIKVKKMIPSAKLYSTKFKTTKTGQTVIDDVLGDVPKKVVSHEEIKKATFVVNSETTRLLGDEQTKNMSAAFANLHNEINNLSKGGKVTPEIVGKLKTAFEHRANAGRILEGLKVAYENEGAKNPLMTQYIEKAIKQLGDIDKVLKAAKGVDFNNVEAANDFVRQFIKPKAEDWLTKLRYSSMLSSPSTWETNAESNLQGTGLIAPIEKTILGGIDWLSSSVTGKPRKYLAGEGAQYVKAYYNLGNLKDAYNKFKNIIKTGRATDVNKYEIRTIPLTKAGTVGRTVETIIDAPGRILLATDAFFQHLTSKGIEKSINYRQSKGVGTIDDIIGAASTEARERLFNQELKAGSGGYVSKAIGLLGDKVNTLRSNKNPIIRYMANFTLPFIKIPTNIMRTSIQYSPFGVADMLGSPDKQTSLAKIVLGTGVAMTTGLLASSDKITAGLPKSEKLRKAWKEANIQPWSIKVGDNWYSYQNLHPAIGFNMALASYFKSNLQEIPNSQAEKVLGIFGVAANKIFAQSYTKNISNLFDAVNGDATALSKMASNYPSQLIPFRAFQGWLNRAFDPKVRNTDPEGTGLARQLDGILKQVQNNIVGMSGNLPVRTNAYGEELQNSASNRAWNSLFSPRTTTENAPGMEVFKNMLQNKNIDKQKELDIQGIIKNSPQTGTAGSLATTQTTGDAGLDLIIKQETEKARIKTISDILTRKGDYKDVPLGETQTQRLLQMEKVQPQEIEQAKIKAISSLGTKETVDYIKSQPSVDFTSLYQQGALTPAVAKEMERQGYIQDSDALMKKLQLTDVYYQNKAARATVKKLSKLKVRTMKSILKSQKTKTIKMPKTSIMKVKPVKFRKMPKIKGIKKVKSYKMKIKRLSL